MCGRYILVQRLEVIEKRFNVKAPENMVWSPSYNIAPGQLAPVITSDNPNHLDLMHFGMTPFWAKKRMYLFNARAEGDRNKSNEVGYTGAKDIIIKPAFRKPIRSQRCIVIADAFVEGTTKDGLKDPFLVFLQNKERPFAFAGIFDEWKNPENGEIIQSFSIITTTPNTLMQKIPHHRMPVIIEKGMEKRWLNLKTPLANLTKMLKPFDSNLMNAYSITNKISNSKNNNADLIIPQGERLSPEFNIRRNDEIHLQGMGRYK